MVDVSCYDHNTEGWFNQDNEQLLSEYNDPTWQNCIRLVYDSRLREMRMCVRALPVKANCMSPELDMFLQQFNLQFTSQDPDDYPNVVPGTWLQIDGLPWMIEAADLSNNEVRVRRKAREPITRILSFDQCNNYVIGYS